MNYSATQFLALSIFIIILFLACSPKDKSNPITRTSNKLSLSKYDSITDLKYFSGNYEVMVVMHLGNDFKSKKKHGKMKVSEAGLELVVDLDSLVSIKASHDRTNLTNISRGNFVFKGINEIESAALRFDEKNYLIAFGYSISGKNYTTIFVYKKVD